MKQQERRKQVLGFIQSYSAAHGGRMPSTREIALGCGLKSHSGVVFHLKKLEQAGLIELEHGQARAIVLPQAS